MPDTVADLFGKKIKQGRRGLSHDVFKIHRINFTPAEVPREQDLSETVNDVNDAFFGWNRFIINVRVAMTLSLDGIGS
jgi:hypothetical protein